MIPNPKRHLSGATDWQRGWISWGKSGILGGWQCYGGRRDARYSIIPAAL